MKLDVIIRPSGDLRRDVEEIKAAEQLGFDGVWVAETAHNPFFALTIAAQSTSTIMLGARCAHAFRRSPMVTAQIGWDLARQSEGRFALDLGIEASAMPDSRLGEEASDPVGRMREYVESLRAIWETFQTDARLRYRGRYYQFRLMAPFFNPGPIGRPAIPVHLAGDTPSMFQLAGERFDGLRAQFFHTPSYLRSVVLPAMRAGAQAEHRTQDKIELTVPALIVSGNSQAETLHAEASARTRLTRLATRADFRQVMRHQGWTTQASAFRDLARRSKRDESQTQISADMLRQFAIVAPAEDLYASIVERYDGLADRVCLAWKADNRDLLKAIAAGRRER